MGRDPVCFEDLLFSVLLCPPLSALCLRSSVHLVLSSACPVCSVCLACLFCPVCLSLSICLSCSVCPSVCSFCSVCPSRLSVCPASVCFICSVPSKCTLRHRSQIPCTCYRIQSSLASLTRRAQHRPKAQTNTQNSSKAQGRQSIKERISIHFIPPAVSHIASCFISRPL